MHTFISRPSDGADRVSLFKKCIHDPGGYESVRTSDEDFPRDYSWHFSISEAKGCLKGNFIWSIHRHSYMYAQILLCERWQVNIGHGISPWLLAFKSVYGVFITQIRIGKSKDEYSLWKNIRICSSTNFGLHIIKARYRYWQEVCSWSNDGC